jgi:hypothetical protein
MSGLIRPNGKPYRPRGVMAHAWENGPGEGQGVVITGTHDVERAQEFADQMMRYWYGSDTEAGMPTIGWWRCSYLNGELRWHEDAERGAAGVMFTDTQGFA